MPEKNTELADFLRRARSQVDASRAGLPADGRVRRVPGLRREEVAFLAGVSTDYYARLEQGYSLNASPEVLDAIARALRLDEAERRHLHDLAAGTRARPALRRSAPERLTAELAQLVEAMAPPLRVTFARSHAGVVAPLPMTPTASVPPLTVMLLASLASLLLKPSALMDAPELRPTWRMPPDCSHEPP